ncbi:MAG: hypothetical protein VX683_06905, partial [Cyanobacteriota bacterium]|nr:hypothetical protein [Cyanobacteriota bacterium]
MTTATTRLADYRPYPFHIPNIELDVVVEEQHIAISSFMQIEPALTSKVPLVLPGLDLELDSIVINGSSVPTDAYSLS